MKGRVKEDSYDFYRCYSCSRAITRLEEIEFSDPESARYSKACIGCGGARYSPIDWTMLTWWERLQPRVLFFTVVRAAGEL